MPANEIHKGDIGTQFQVTIKDGSAAVDISSATTKLLKFKKPSGTVLEKPALFYTDGSDGILKYDIVSGDLSEVGTWFLQGFVVFDSGTFNSDITKFKVHKNLE